MGGNCYTEDRDGVHVHMYGAHIFHTNDESIWSYIGQFASFNTYQHTVRAIYQGKPYTFPINLTTMREVFGNHSKERLLSIVRAECAPYQRSRLDNVENWCLANIGPTLYRMFIEGYTCKHWRRPPSELKASVVRRLSFREDENDNYFLNQRQGIPIGGYTQIFQRLLTGIEVRTGVDFFSDRTYWTKLANKIVFTGEIDRFFDYKHGRLEWRSLRFDQEQFESQDKQGYAVVNYTEESVPYTRSIEHRHFDPERTRHIPVTHVTREYPAELADTKEAYYPVPTLRNQALFQTYQDMADKVKSSVIFGGRLANYVYIDMAPAIKMALNAAKKELRNTSLE